MYTHSIPRTPLIFVPGLFGSMSNVIIPGTGGWSFGVAGIYYEPFVRSLESMGYVLNQTLFIAFYDWRQRIPVSARMYLTQTIKKAKQKTGASKVNLICHSMGGLEARAYVQSAYYQDDVDQLIQLCTPNAGSPVYYGYWTGETVEHQTDNHVNVVYLYMKWYLDYLGQLYPTNRLWAVHTFFPSLLDVVPCEAFGDYLLVAGLGPMRFITYEMMQVKNSFLDELDAHRHVITSRNIDVTIIAGIEQKTIQYLRTIQGVEVNYLTSGAVWSPVSSYTGDGNVIVDSAFALDGDKYLIDGDHMQVLFKSYELLRKKLT
ncbi:esterase/lipase family protein [Paenibacillus sp. GCM10027628]|uniref:esterase/lipase family protein n=1 Tax=Paenibacillus sp. GCM10027628 TaxID=3273413 RepID=UPI003632B37D